jgi:predicted kinase
MSQPKVYILVGVPGSGKSTWAQNQEWAKDCAYASTDWYVEYYAASTGRTYSSVFEECMPKAVEAMLDQVKAARDQRKDIIWDQTSTSIRTRKKKLVLLPEYYPIAVVFKTPEKEELERRLASRPGKEIPKHVLEQFMNFWEEPTEEEGFKEIWYAT